MDRTPEPLTADDPVPPASAKTVFTLQIAGAVVCVLTAIPALFGGVAPGLVSSIILASIAVGTLSAVYGLTLLPGDWRAWSLASAACLFANWGFPAHWDSFALVARVLAFVFFVGALLTVVASLMRLVALCFSITFDENKDIALVASILRYSVLSVLLLFHFGGIFTATTWPEPAPWLTTQSAQRVYMPYYRFMYLSNAYHFYSPEPGPASLIFGLVTYELDEIDPKTGKQRVEAAWIDLPNRGSQFKDPLGLTYQRRLSITELVATSSPSNFTPDNFEKNDAVARRRQAAVNVDDPSSRIPMLPNVDPVASQYRVPSIHITRYLMPSYARHIAAEYSSPGRRVLSVKLLRVEHRVIPPGQFLPQYDPETGLKRDEGDSPYNPTTYRPYYLGEYNAAGELVNPTDPMLYWLLPIVQRASPNAQGRFFDDYMSLYLKHEYPWTGGVKGAP